MCIVGTHHLDVDAGMIVEMTPEQDGYYWFKGKVRGFDYAGIVEYRFAQHRNKHYVNATGRGGTYHPDDLEGEWWGPLTPPWEDEERKCCGKDTCKEDTEE